MIGGIMPVLADILIRGALPTGPAGDVIWRNANLNAVTFTGILPSPSTVDEFLALADLGRSGEDLARLLPDRSQIGKLVNHASPTVRKGVAANVTASRSDLETLAADPVADVATAAAAELARREALATAAAGGDVAAAREILTAPLVEEIAGLLDAAPEVLAAAVASADSGLGRIEALAPALVARVGLTVMTDARCMIPAAIAAWVCGTSPEAQTALDAALASGRHELHRRCTPAALRVLAHAGHVTLPGAVEPERSHVQLDDMALVLETFEIAGLYFSSSDNVTNELRARIFEEAPVQMVVNHLLGQTPRRPAFGEVHAVLLELSSDRRSELSNALEETLGKMAAAGHEDPISGLPWSGELLLCLQRARAVALPSDSVTELLAVIDGMLAGDELAWEYLLALSDEWEGALIDLVVSAANMEGITA
jgi:hypothetical protein